MHGEGLFFVQETETQHPQANLLFTPHKMLVLSSADGQTTYLPGIDYLFTPGQRTILLPQGSRIPFRTAAQIYPPATADLPAYPPGRPNQAQKMPHKTGAPD